MASLLDMKEILIGRKEEGALLENVKNAQKSVFVAVYGRLYLILRWQRKKYRGQTTDFQNGNL